MKRLVIVLILSSTFFSCQQNKTAYVSNSDIMDGFEKLKQTEDNFAKEEEAMNARIDSLVSASGYQELVQEYQSKQGKMPKAKEEELYNQIMQIQQRLGQQQKMTSQQFQQRKNAEMDSLVKTVKDFIKEYGKKNGYTYIYGANESGNILYGQENLDITDDVIKALNQKYSENSNESDEAESKNDSVQ